MKEEKWLVDVIKLPEPFPQIISTFLFIYLFIFTFF